MNFSHRNSSLQLNALFLNGGLREPPTGKAYSAIEMHFPVLCGFIGRETGYTMSPKIMRAPTIHGLLTSRVMSHN